MEIKYYYNLDNKWLEDLAVEISRLTGTFVEVVNNKIITPPVLGSGSYSLYEFRNNVSIILLDCTLKVPVNIHRIPVPGNVSYKIIFNISEAPIVITKESGTTVNISDSLAESVFFESHSTETFLHLAANRPIRSVALIFDKSWATSYLAKELLVVNTGKLEQIVTNALMQFTASLDLEMHSIVEEILSENNVSESFPSYIEGCAYQLLALFFQNLILNDLRKQYTLADEIERLQKLKEEIEANIDLPIPSLNLAAKKCAMSKSRFSDIFKKIHDQNYGEYFQSVKLYKARELLLQGIPIKDAAGKVGYSNLAFFAQLFTKYFGSEPSVYKGAI